MSFAGKTVLITGAARGFGATTAKAFSDAGANLVLGDISSDGLGEGLHSSVLTLKGDVSDPAYSRALVNMAYETFGGLNVAINNAGIVNEIGKIPETPEDEVRRVIEVNLLGTFWALQAQLPAMESSGGGAIVNIASVAGLSGAPRLGIYGASKHGVVGLTKTAALEYARKGIRVNAICPSFAATAMAGDAVDDPKVEAYMTRGVPMRRLATVDEVVQAILWAANPDNSFTTGQMIAIDGGLGAI